MFGAALFEIIILLVIRPVRFLLGLVSKRAANRLQRVEEWLLHQSHAMGVESRTRYEVEKSAEAKAHLASGLTDQSRNVPSLRGDAMEQARRLSGADQAVPHSAEDADPGLKRGPRQVEARQGQTRSEEMQKALLQAQREQRARAERERRRRP